MTQRLVDIHAAGLRCDYFQEDEIGNHINVEVAVLPCTLFSLLPDEVLLSSGTTRAPKTDSSL